MNQQEFFVGSDFSRAPRETLERLKGYGACVVSDAMKGFNVMDSSIFPIVPGSAACGCAVTVRLRPGDNLMLHRAIEAARPGDVLVLDTCGSRRTAVIGDMMCQAAFDNKKISGLVIDGAVRDVEALRKRGFPVFAAAIVPSTGGSEGPGQLNHPISCGAVPVHAGDIIVADDNGVSVVPQAWAELVLENCEKRVQFERRRMGEILAGQTTSGKILEELEKNGY